MPIQSLSNNHLLKALAWNIPLVILSQLPRLCPLPTSCPPPACLLRKHTGKKKKPCHCASTAQQQLDTGVLLTLLQSQIQNTAPYRLLWRKSTQADPEHLQSHSQIFQTANRAGATCTIGGLKESCFSRVVIQIYMLCMFLRTACQCCQHVKEKHESCQGLIN